MNLNTLITEYRKARYAGDHAQATSLAFRIRGMIEARGSIPNLPTVNLTACIHALARSEGGGIVSGETIRRTDSKDGKGKAGDRMSLPFRLGAGKDQVKGVIPPHMRIADDERSGVLTVYAMRGPGRSGFRRLNVKDLQSLTLRGRKLRVGGTA